MKVSVDNFGTSYTSLGNLKKLPLDALKIDRSFVSKITGSPDQAAAKVSSMIEMGQDLNLRVIAEGVESIEGLEFLWAHNCDEAVGYYFGQPVPAEQFGENFQPQCVLEGEELIRDDSELKWKSFRLSALSNNAASGGGAYQLRRFALGRPSSRTYRHLLFRARSL